MSDEKSTTASFNPWQPVCFECLSIAGIDEPRQAPSTMACTVCEVEYHYPDPRVPITVACMRFVDREVVGLIEREHGDRCRMARREQRPPPERVSLRDLIQRARVLTSAIQRQEWWPSERVELEEPHRNLQQALGQITPEVARTYECAWDYVQAKGVAVDGRGEILRVGEESARAVRLQPISDQVDRMLGITRERRAEAAMHAAERLHEDREQRTAGTADASIRQRWADRLHALHLDVATESFADLAATMRRWADEMHPPLGPKPEFEVPAPLGGMTPEQHHAAETAASNLGAVVSARVLDWLARSVRALERISGQQTAVLRLTMSGANVDGVRSGDDDDHLEADVDFEESTYASVTGQIRRGP